MDWKDAPTRSPRDPDRGAPSATAHLVRVFALATLAFVGVQFHLTYQTATLTCTRGADDGGECVVARQEGVYYSSERFPVRELSGARVDVSEVPAKQGGTSRVRRVVVVRVGGETPLHGAFHSAYEQDYQALADQIASFARDPRARELAVSDDRGRRQFLIVLLVIGLWGPPLAFLVIWLVARDAAQAARDAERLPRP